MSRGIRRGSTSLRSAPPTSRRRVWPRSPACRRKLSSASRVNTPRRSPRLFASVWRSNEARAVAMPCGQSSRCRHWSALGVTLAGASCRTRSEQFLTDTALYADLVLPAATQLEQLDLMYSWGHFYLTWNEQAIPPLGEAV